MPGSETLAALRELVRARFPSGARAPGGVVPTGIAAADEPAGGGLPRGALSELVCAAPSCGSQLFLGRMLEAARERGGRAGLIDASDQFDPGSWPEEILPGLVWVRCRTAEEAMPAADLLARDANLEWVAIDLRAAGPAALRAIPDSSWYRLQLAAEQTGAALLTLTPRPMVPSARLRLILEHSHGLLAQSQERPELLDLLSIQQSRTRLSATG